MAQSLSRSELRNLAESAGPALKNSVPSPAHTGARMPPRSAWDSWVWPLAATMRASEAALKSWGEDEVTPPRQLYAVRRYVATPRQEIRAALAPGGHLSLFMGARTLAKEWADIAHRLKTPSRALYTKSRTIDSESRALGKPQ